MAFGNPVVDLRDVLFEFLRVHARGHGRFREHREVADGDADAAGLLRWKELFVDVVAGGVWKGRGLLQWVVQRQGCYKSSNDLRYKEADGCSHSGSWRWTKQYLLRCFLLGRPQELALALL